MWPTWLTWEGLWSVLPWDIGIIAPIHPNPKFSIL